MIEGDQHIVSLRRHVVLVCMVDSIHSARWIEQFRDQAIDFTLFPSTPNRAVHPRIIEMCAPGASQTMTVTIEPLGGLLSVPLWILDLALGDRIRGAWLRRLIGRIRPDFVHAMELNHGGYIAARAYRGLGNPPPLIATNWGSDIYWFSRFPRHERRLRALLRQASYYSAECHRDIDLAIEHGFTGRAFDVFPNAGGLPANRLSLAVEPPSTRRVIAIKGYESFVGRASTALEAVDLCAEDLAGYQIVVYSANIRTQRLAAALARKSGLEIRCHPKNSLSHVQMLNLFASARVYLGVSLSDGISTSLLEAMASGSFPIQTDTSCANEWVEDGKSGFVVDAHAPRIIAHALSRAVNESELVDNAARLNLVTARERLNEDSIKLKALQFYGAMDPDGQRQGRHS